MERLDDHRLVELQAAPHRSAGIENKAGERYILRGAAIITGKECILYDRRGKTWLREFSSKATRQ